MKCVRSRSLKGSRRITMNCGLAVIFLVQRYTVDLLTLTTTPVDPDDIFLTSRNLLALS